MQIQSTSDISLQALRSEVAALPEELSVTVDESQSFYKSAESPSWVQFLADFSWWKQAFAVYVAVYVAELVRAAAKDTWKNKAKVVKLAKTRSQALFRTFVRSVVRIRKLGSARTEVRAALPVPDEYWGTWLVLEGDDESTIEAQLALFVHHLPALQHFMDQRGLLDDGGAGPVFLTVLDDGSLQAEWQDPKTHQRLSHVFPLDAA